MIQKDVLKSVCYQCAAPSDHVDSWDVILCFNYVGGRIWKRTEIEASGAENNAMYESDFPFPSSLFCKLLCTELNQTPVPDPVNANFQISFTDDWSLPTFVLNCCSGVMFVSVYVPCTEVCFPCAQHFFSANSAYRIMCKKKKNMFVSIQTYSNLEEAGFLCDSFRRATDHYFRWGFQPSVPKLATNMNNTFL